MDDVHRVVEGDAGLCDVGGQDDLQEAGNNNRRWTGKGGFQAAGQAEEHTGWMAGSYGVGDPGPRRTRRFKGPMTCHQVWCD